MAIKDRKITGKQFAMGVKELRTYIQASVSPFGKDFPENKNERIARSALDKEYFFRAYLPHYFYEPSAPFHREMHRLADELLVAIQAPRGFAKSTHMTFGEILYDICFAKEYYILLVAAVKELAEDFSQAIKLELEENPRILHDFGALKTEDWLDDEFITANEVKVEALGSGQKPRGRKYKMHRVTKIGCDDLEDDQQAIKPERVDKLQRWLLGALRPTLEPNCIRRPFKLPVGMEAFIRRVFGEAPFQSGKIEKREDGLYRIWESGAKMFVVGTLLSSDALLARMINPENNKFNKWIKRDYHAIDKNGKSIWPERWPISKLMAEREIMDEEIFAREFMGTPPDKSVIRIKEEEIQYFTDQDYDLKNLPKYGALDPSLGKFRSDYQAISAGAIAPDNTVLLYEGLALREPPLKLCERIIELQRRDGFISFGVEGIAFQEVLKDILEEKAKVKKVFISVVLTEAAIAKDLRIEKIMPLIKSGRIKFHISLKNSEYLRCFINWRPGVNGKDDPPDSCEQLLQIIAKGSALPKVTTGKRRSGNYEGFSEKADYTRF